MFSGPWAKAASWERPGASPNRPGAPRRLQDRFWSDFCSIFRRFWVDFSSIFAFRVRLFRCFRRAGAARRVACAVAAASDKALTLWGLRLPPCSAVSPVPGVRAFSRAAVLARSHAPRATCRTPRSPPCSATGTALTGCCRRASHRGAFLSTRWRTAEHCAFALRRRRDEKTLKRKRSTRAPALLQVYVCASLRVCVWSCGRPSARNNLLVTPSPVQH